MDIERLKALDADVTADLNAAHKSLTQMQDMLHSRELALAITKLEECQLWNVAARSGLSAIMALSESHVPGNEGS